MRSWTLLLSLGLLLFMPACATAPSEPVTGAAPEEQPEAGTNEAFLDDLEERTFRFFWETTNPENGLAPDRWPSEPFSSVAAVGFALTSYPIGVERGYVSRQEARDRVLTTLEFFMEAPQAERARRVTGRWGFYYHFLDMETGYRFEDVELSTIDTALLMAGVLTNQEYFDRDHPEERRIRALADSLYRRVEWDRMQLPSGLISMGWTPKEGRFDYGYEGYDEAMILYVLALGSPTHPVEEGAWDAFTSTYRWADFYGYEHLNFSPLFGHQYSHIWIDFRDIQDDYMRQKGITYFDNSRRATYAQRAYAIDNPNNWRGYGENIWGLTASDGPANVTKVVNGEKRQFHTYWARGASEDDIRDDGTIAPTAAGGSIPFAPEIAIPALKTMKERYGEELWGEYGFLDAFNPTFTFEEADVLRGTVNEDGWFNSDYIGIDQGPIVTMIENHRSGLIWKLMRDNPYIQRGLRRAGFSGGWLEEGQANQ